MWRQFSGVENFKMISLLGPYNSNQEAVQLFDFGAAYDLCPSVTQKEDKGQRRSHQSGSLVEELLYTV